MRGKRVKKLRKLYRASIKPYFEKHGEGFSTFRAFKKSHTYKHTKPLYNTKRSKYVEWHVRHVLDKFKNRRWINAAVDRDTVA